MKGPRRRLAGVTLYLVTVLVWYHRLGQCGKLRYRILAVSAYRTFNMTFLDGHISAATDWDTYRVDTTMQNRG